MSFQNMDTKKQQARYELAKTELTGPFIAMDLSQVLNIDISSARSILTRFQEKDLVECIAVSETGLKTWKFNDTTEVQDVLKDYAKDHAKLEQDQDRLSYLEGWREGILLGLGISKATTCQ
jgi:hypothetical protein